MQYGSDELSKKGKRTSNFDSKFQELSET